MWWGSGGDTAAEGREHSRNLQYEGPSPQYVFPGAPKSVLVRQAQPPVHPGMQQLKWAGNHTWITTNGRLPTPLF